jgi:hypothetical protein
MTLPALTLLRDLEPSADVLDGLVAIEEIETAGLHIAAHLFSSLLAFWAVSL